MNDALILKINPDKTWTLPEELTLGLVLENGVKTLIIEIPTIFKEGWKYYLEFLKPHGDKLSTPEIEGNYDELEDKLTITYEIKSGLIDQNGYYEFSFTARNFTTNQVWKSRIVKTKAEKAINAYDQEQECEDFIIKFTKQVVQNTEDISLLKTFKSVLETTTIPGINNSINSINNDLQTTKANLESTKNRVSIAEFNIDNLEEDFNELNSSHNVTSATLANLILEVAKKLDVQTLVEQTIKSKIKFEDIITVASISAFLGQSIQVLNDMSVNGILKILQPVSDASTDDTVASIKYVKDKVAAILGQAPELLNALDELAAALGNDPNFSTTMLNLIGTKVDKTTTVNNKALSGPIVLDKTDIGLPNVINALQATKVEFDALVAIVNTKANNADLAPVLDIDRLEYFSSGLNKVKTTVQFVSEILALVKAANHRYPIDVGFRYQYSGGKTLTLSDAPYTDFAGKISFITTGAALVNGIVEIIRGNNPATEAFKSQVHYGLYREDSNTFSGFSSDRSDLQRILSGELMVGQAKEIASYLQPQEVTHERLVSSIIATNQFEIKDGMSKITEVKANEPINLIVNGDFSNGTTGWTAGSSTITNINNRLQIQANIQYGGPRQVISNLIVGNKYYVRATLDSVGADKGILIATLGTTSTSKTQAGVQTLSFIFTATATSHEFRAYENKVSDFDVFYLDDVIQYDLTFLINRGLFNGLTEAQIKTQLDTWIINGFPTTITELISRNDNLFKQAFQSLTSIYSENLVPNPSYASGNLNWTVGSSIIDFVVNNGTVTFTGKGGLGISALNWIRTQNPIFSNFVDKHYIVIRAKQNNGSGGILQVGNGYNPQATFTLSSNYQNFSVVFIPTNNASNPSYLTYSANNNINVSVEFIEDINVSDLIVRNLLPNGITDAEYKTLLDSNTLTNRKESDFIKVEPSVAYKVVKPASDVTTTIKVEEYTFTKQFISYQTATFVNGVATLSNTNTLTHYVKLITNNASQTQMAYKYNLADNTIKKYYEDILPINKTISSLNGVGEILDNTKLDKTILSAFNYGQFEIRYSGFAPTMKALFALDLFAQLKTVTDYLIEARKDNDELLKRIVALEALHP